MKKLVLGGNIGKKDKRDIKLGKVQLPVSYPKEYQADVSWLKTLWQNGYPECGAHAGAVFKAILEHVNDGLTRTYSPVYLWKKIKSIDEFAPEDGTDMRSIFKALAKFGVCDYVMLPTNYQESLEQHTKDNTTEEQNKNAQPNIIKAYAFGETDVENIKRDLFLNKVLLVLVDVGDTWWGQRIVKKFSRKDGGHFIVAYGYDDYYLYIIDSADKAVPFKQLPLYAYTIRQTGTAVDLPNDVVLNLTTKISLLQRIIELMLALKRSSIKS